MSGLEPLAAFGLACNVIQVLSFAGEVCKATKAFYKGGVVDPALAAASQSLTKACADIEANTASRPLTRAQQEAVDIAKSCREVAMSLITEINKSSISGIKVSLTGSILAGFKSAIKVRSRRVEQIEKQQAAY